MEPRQPHENLCARCGTANFLTASKCWVCGSTDLVGPATTTATAATAGPAKPEPAWFLGDDLAPPRGSGVSYAKPVVAVVAVVLATAFLAGMWRENPGLAVFLAFIIGGTILAILGRRGAPSPSTDPGESAARSILRTFASVAMTLAIIVVIIAVAAVAFFIFLVVSCLSMFKQ